MSLPSCRQDCRPRVISVSMSAIFFCISWFLANGTPNWILVKYWNTGFKIFTQNKPYLWLNSYMLCRFILDKTESCSSMFLKTKKFFWDHWLMFGYRFLPQRCLYNCSDVLTCPLCTDVLHGSRTLQLPALPRRSRNERCLSSQMDPGQHQKWGIINLQQVIHGTVERTYVIGAWVIMALHKTLLQTNFQCNNKIIRVVAPACHRSLFGVRW